MIVFTYPGQGSQRPQMGAPWADHPSWELVEEASEAVDRDVAALLLDADAEELTMTRNAQLATFTMSMVVLDAVSRLGSRSRRSCRAQPRGILSTHCLRRSRFRRRRAFGQRTRRCHASRCR